MKVLQGTSPVTTVFLGTLFIGSKAALLNVVVVAFTVDDVTTELRRNPIPRTDVDDPFFTVEAEHVVFAI